MIGAVIQDAIASDITGLLERDGGLLAVLDQILEHFGCTVGTVHSLNPESSLLQLEGQRGIPEMLLPRVRSIPVGKGMAGLAAERQAPVQVCNLQTDTSGVAKPAAKETRMEGSISLPMMVDERVCGVLGVAKPVAYEFREDEIELLLDIAATIGRFLER